MMSENEAEFPDGWTTLHLTPREVWERQRTGEQYLPEAFDADGFVHCTDGDVNLIAVGNRYYQADIRPFVALTIAVDELDSPIRYEDAARIYPHIYGPINCSAVAQVRAVIRDPDGTFVSLGDIAVT